MIRTPFFTRPFIGFRFTHDVLWRDYLVGEATEVRLLPPDNGYTWSVFAMFYDTPCAAAAIASDDVHDDVILVIAGAPGRRPFQNIALAAQEVVLRGPSKGGSCVLLPRSNPLPIDGKTALDADELAEWKRRLPDIIAW